MSAFVLNRFSGIFPRTPDAQLPEGAASLAQNCDFAYGELRNTKGGYLVNTMVNAPKSVYTDDGLKFYTWTTDVNAVRSPLVNDTFDRLYWTDGNSFRVGVRSNATTSGGAPGSSYAVGVPRPSAAPTLTVTLPVVDATTANFTFKFHYEAGGVKYQEQTIVVTTLSAAQYRFTAPAMVAMLTFGTLENFPAVGESGKVYKALDTGTMYSWAGSVYTVTTTDATPFQAVPVLRITAVSKVDASQFFDLYTENSALGADGGLYSLELTNDAGATTMTVTIATAIAEADKKTRAYAYAYVNTYGEEGPLSPPATVTTSPLVGATLNATRDAIGAYAPIKEIRFYRTPDDSEIADYFYVGSITVLGQPGSNFILVDTTKGSQLNEPFASDDFYPPPVNLSGLMDLGNGILCAWKDHELWFSEAFKPWAWPPKYAKPLRHRIVGGISHGSGAVITTVGNPYLLSGVSPDSMTASRLNNVEQAAVSKWAIAVAPEGVVYASNDGIVVVSGAAGSIRESERFFTREVWRARYGAALSTMRFALWDGRLIVYSSTAAFTAFMIRLDEAAGAMTDLPNFTAACTFVSQLSDQLYYAQGSGLYQFNGGADQTAVWQSRDAIVGRPVNFGVFQTIVSGVWTVQFYADGVLRHTVALAAGTNTYRLPSGFEAARWKVKISGAGRFESIRVAQTGRELARV